MKILSTPYAKPEKYAKISSLSSDEKIWGFYTEMQFRQMLPILEIPCWLKELHSFQEKGGFLKLFKMLENTSGRILVPEWGSPSAYS